MSSTNHPITKTVDHLGKPCWKVNGKTYYSELEAIERQKELDDDDERRRKDEPSPMG
jgi:hypothetical protein